MARHSATMRPVKGDCVETANGKRRTVIKTSRAGIECDPRSFSEFVGYDIHYRRPTGDKLYVCWLGTWQEWCSKNKATPLVDQE